MWGELMDWQYWIMSIVGYLSIALILGALNRRFELLSVKPNESPSHLFWAALLWPLIGLLFLMLAIHDLPYQLGYLFMYRKDEK